MKILVTGCGGFIGSTLVDYLLEQHHYVVGIDNLNTFYDPKVKVENLEKAREHKNFAFMNQDIKDLNTIFCGSIDYVIHLAAYPGVRPSFLMPQTYLENNINGTLSVLNFAKANKVRFVIFASSSSVYGNCKDVPFKETAMVQPISVYGASKVAGEALCRAYSDAYDLNITCLRFFTCYGPRQRPDLAIYKFVKSMLEDNVISVYGDGKTSRDYTYIDDIVGGIILAATKKLKGYNVLNLGNNQPILLRVLISEIENVLELKAKTEFCPIPNGDVLHTCADPTKANELLGWKPKMSLQDGLLKFTTWMKGNLEC